MIVFVIDITSMKDLIH